MDPAQPVETGRGERIAPFALGSATLGLAAVAVMYWLVLPAVVLGLGGLVLGFVARRRGVSTAAARDMTMAAICLGAVAVLFTPVVLWQTKGAEEWGRDCALRPQHDPNCPRPSSGE